MCLLVFFIFIFLDPFPPLRHFPYFHSFLRLFSLLYTFSSSCSYLSYTVWSRYPFSFHSSFFPLHFYHFYYDRFRFIYSFPFTQSHSCFLWLSSPLFLFLLSFTFPVFSYSSSFFSLPHLFFLFSHSPFSLLLHFSIHSCILLFFSFSLFTLLSFFSFPAIIVIFISM